MATAVLPNRSPARRWPRRVAASLLGLVLVAIVATLWAYGIAFSALPQLDGTLRLTGVQQRVVVTRDRFGVATIEAANLTDLFFAQGYVTAQDRLWQMDIMRRFAEGDLAEVVGNSGLAHDQEQRVLGIRHAAHRAAQELNPRDRSYFEAYARGVNANMEHSRPHLPLEFLILKYAPRPWAIDDSFAIGAQLAEDLNHGTYHSALLRERFQSALGPELTADLFVNHSRHDHPPALEATKEAPAASQPMDEDNEMDPDTEPVARGASPLPPSPRHLPPHPATLIILNEAKNSTTTDGRITLASFLTGHMFHNNNDPLRPGSNNWAVSGAHTVSGKPLLSNDMHLDHQMPNLWYEAHLSSGDFNVVGVTLPGMPFVIVGHNQRIAWGFTNVGPTVEDVYIENFNATGQYQTPQCWRDPEHRVETIHVKDAPDVSMEVTLTRHGPIISELVPGETRRLALRWTLYNSFNDPFFDIDAAQNWQDFRKALATWSSPAQNVMYADLDGHIGYQATGQIPIRAAGDGSLPVNGSDDAHEWISYIPFEKLPSVFDPPSGVLATANGRITPDNYPYSISTEWDAPWRTERIYRVLTSGKKLASPDMLALETDVYSDFDHACAERFVQALDAAPNLSERAKKARDLLRDWDGRLSVDSAAATIEVKARRALVRLLLETQLETQLSSISGSVSRQPPLTWESYQWFMSSVWLDNILSQQPKRWLPSGYESFNSLMVTAVETTVRDSETPAVLSQRRWGQVAPLEISHLVLSHLPLLGRWTGPGRHEQSGGSFTVKQVGRDFGPSERFTADLSNFDQSTLNTVTGQAGNFLSPHYMDQWDAWSEGATFTLPFSPDAVRRARTHELLLEPEN